MQVCLSMQNQLLEYWLRTRANVSELDHGQLMYKFEHNMNFQFVNDNIWSVVDLVQLNQGKGGYA